MQPADRARRLIEAFDELERRRHQESELLRGWVVRLLTGQDGSSSALAGGVAHDQVDVRLLLDLDAVAERLSVSLSTVKRLVADGRLPVVKVANATRVRRRDLEQYVQDLPTDRRPA